MAIALDPKRRVDYVLKAERGTETPTVFHLRALTFRERCDLNDALMAVEGGETFYRTGTLQRERLRSGLVGWSNFNDASGAAVRFVADPNGKASDASLDYLDQATASELSDAIADLSVLSGPDRD